MGIYELRLWCHGVFLLSDCNDSDGTLRKIVDHLPMEAASIPNEPRVLGSSIAKAAKCGL